MDTTTTTTPTPTPTPTTRRRPKKTPEKADTGAQRARARLTALKASVAGAFVGRDSLIETLVVGLIAGVNVALLGLPGTAKSELALAFARALGARSFSWLLTKFTSPDEVFGPPSLSGLKADRFTRVTRGKLPEAEIAFLDEAFKANSGVLNAMLTALNERVFYDDGGAVAMPLRFAIAASNEYPGGGGGKAAPTGELGALWDRFAIRHWVEHTASPADFERLIDLGLGLDGVGAQGGKGAVPEGVASVADADLARAEAAKLPVSKATVKALFAVRADLAGSGIHLGDRRAVTAMRVARAYAWLQGDDQVLPGHLAILDSVLWDHHDQRPLVVEALSKHCASKLADARRAFAGFVTFEEQKMRAIASGDSAIGEAGVLHQQAKRLVEKLQALQHEAGGDEARRIGELVATAEAKRVNAADKLSELSGLPRF